MRITQKADSFLKKWFSQDSFSGIIWIEQNGKLMFARAYGYACRTSLAFNKLNTRFGTASGTKGFTAVGICTLIDQGKLHPEDQLTQLLPFDFPNINPVVSVRQLLTHTSGITSYFEEDIDPDYEKLWHDRPVYSMQTLQDFLPMFRNKPMRSKPGERWDYNDGGYILLGLIIEAVSGQSYQDFIQENVFNKAGMKSSGFFRTDQLPPNTARGYIHNTKNKTFRSNIFSIPVIGASDGGAFTTAADMTKFWETLHSNGFFSKEMTDQMLSIQVTANKEKDIHYGYGIWIKTNNPDPLYNLQGDDPGVSLFSTFGKQNTIVHLISNTNYDVWSLHKNMCEELELY